MVAIYVGLWNDHSLGPILGRTITVSTRNGDYLIAALSLFITIVGASFWSLVAFAIHQYNCLVRNADLFHRQLQVEYRNTSSTAATVFTVLKLLVAWFGEMQCVKRRAFIRLLPPLVIGIGFTAASILVSNVAAPSYSTSDVLVSPGRCGLVQYPTFNPSMNSTSFVPALEQSHLLSQASRTYARTCYENSVQLSDCSFFTVSKIPSTIEAVACPFGTSVCTSDSIRVSSGLLDSNRHLGINSPAADTLKIQYNLTCAVINATPYVQEMQLNSALDLLYDMGPIQGGSSFTFIYNANRVYDGIGYQILPVSTSQAWSPMPPFALDDADTALFFLALNSVSYLQPVADPWFAAHRLLNQSDTQLVDIQYSPDELVSVLGCTEQFQVCKPSLVYSFQAYKQSLACTVISGRTGAATATAHLELSPFQQIVLDRFWDAVDQARVPYVVTNLGVASLLAQDITSETISLGLPPDQWKREVYGWFNTSLAGIQQAIVNYVDAPAELPQGISLKAYNSSAELIEAANRQCSNQRILNARRYQSFSLFDLFFVIIVGFVVILLDLSVERVVGATRRKWPTSTGTARAAAAEDDQLLYLHSRATGLEGLKEGRFGIPVL